VVPLETVTFIPATAADEDEPRSGQPAVDLAVEVVFSPDEAIVGARLEPGAPAVLGRADGVERGRGLALTDERTSRRHAELRWAGGVVRVSDLGSRNGTFVDGERIERAELRAGSVLRVGQSLLVCDEVADAPAPRIPGWIGGSFVTRRLARRLERLAATELAVLLVGETGAGKEVAARALHELSSRRGPFVAVNVSALPRDLVEALLFGHARGAFTGASESSVGFFQRAAGGTLFLDEIGDLPIEQQPKILRVLENRELYVVGSTQPVAFTGRVVTATNADLATATAQGRFRADLLSRIAGSTLEVPPLRRRRLDILPLARHFQGVGRPWSAGFAQALLLHPWPMNVRELKHTMQRLAVDGEGPLLAEELLRPSTPPAPPRGRPSRAELEEALAAARGNVSLVAARYERAAKQIYRWLEHHGLDPAAFRS
jgi:DNA-binding NtrC family response regulator